MGDEFQLNGWVVRPDLNSITSGARTVLVRPKSMEVLLVLAARAGETVPRELILDAVWPDVAVTGDTLTQAIADLRRAFEDEARNPQIIQTVAKRGYRLLPNVSAPAAPQNSARAEDRLRPGAHTDEGRASPAPISGMAALAAAILTLAITFALGGTWSWRKQMHPDSNRVTASSPATSRKQGAGALPRDEVRWGKREFSKWTPEGWGRARDLFEEAASREPGYAAAHAWTGITYCLLGFFDELPRDEAYRRAKAAIDRSRWLNPASSDTLFARAALEFVFEGNLTAAEADYRRSLEIAPNSPWTHWGFAWLLTSEARHAEAIAQMQRAIDLEPVNPYLRTSLGEMYWFGGQPAAARDQFLQVAGLEPSFVRSFDLLILLHETQREYTAAIEARRARAKVRGDGANEAEEFWRAYEKGGEGAYWQMRLEQALAHDRSTRELPYIYAFLGRTDQAIMLLQRQFRPLALTAPQFAPLRGDPRFTALLRHWGLIQ